METVLRQAGEEALRHIRTSGRSGEAFLMHNRELSIEVSSGKVETLKEAEQTGLGIRVFAGGRVGFAYTTDLSGPAVVQTAQEATRITEFSFPDPYNGLPEGRQVYPAMRIRDDDIHSLPLEAKIEMARQVEREARSCHPSIQIIDRAGYEEHETSILIMNSNDLYAFGQANYCGLHVSLAAVTPEETQSGFAYSLQRKAESLDSRKVAKEAADRALRRLQARTIPSQVLPCVIDSQVTARFLGLLSSSIQADNVLKGKSMLAGRMGEVVASPLLTMVDDATYELGVAGFPFDGEGVASTRTMVVEKGRLTGFLYDSYTAMKAGFVSTGNAVRSFRSLPAVGSTSLMVAPGPHQLPALWEGLDKGLYITDIMGMHTANTITGDFSLGAAGLLIEDGRLTYPVRGITIAGNLLELLRKVDGVGGDWRFYGSKIAPSLRCSSLNIAGN
ncbi:MAG: TldD/PmbA family protein [Syntrophomonadaceae bacterium]|nr:TldD/PmbA family protein [Syntrophomonadaceae bacterium]